MTFRQVEEGCRCVHWKKKKDKQMLRLMLKMLFYVLLLTVFTGCRDQVADHQVRTLATFKGGSLTDLDLRAHYNKMRRDPMFREKPGMLTPEVVLDHALNMEMIIAMGLDRKLHLDPQIREEIHSQMSKLFLKVLQDELIEPVERTSVSDEQARAYYDEHLVQYSKKELYRLSAFSIAPEQAETVAEKIRNGELGFAEAAASHALDERERETGGRTGERSLERFRPDWREQVERMTVGELYGPVALDGAMRLLLLEGKTEPYQYSFEEKKEYVRNDVLYQHYRDAWQTIYDDLRERFDVEIDSRAVQDFYRDGLKSAEQKGES
jgi:hypothetical protein